MITFSSVTKDFGSGSPALADLSFHVEKGEFVFLTGASGSGKTTLLRVLTREYKPTSGDVEFNGQLLSKLRGAQIHHHRRSIGVVFQDYRLLPELNVWENIALSLEIANRKQAEIEERVTDLLQLIQLTDKAYNFPAQLSGGEAQRVSIARALATAPFVLLADEPTGNLDPQTTLMIAQLFNKIHQMGTTVFFATHDLSILEAIPHRRIHLDKGRLMSDSKDPGRKPDVPKENTAEKPSEKPAASPSPAAVTAPQPRPSMKPAAPTESKADQAKKGGFFGLFGKGKKKTELTKTEPPKASTPLNSEPPESTPSAKPPSDQELVETVIQIESLEE